MSSRGRGGLMGRECADSYSFYTTTFNVGMERSVDTMPVCTIWVWDMDGNWVSYGKEGILEAKKRNERREKSDQVLQVLSDDRNDTL